MNSKQNSLLMSFMLGFFLLAASITGLIVFSSGSASAASCGSQQAYDGDHYVTINFKAINADDGTPVTGVAVSSGHDLEFNGGYENVDCLVPGTANASNADSSYSLSGADTGVTTGAIRCDNTLPTTDGCTDSDGAVTFLDNCFNTPPYFEIGATPSGYTLDQIDVTVTSKADQTDQYGSTITDFNIGGNSIGDFDYDFGPTYNYNSGGAQPGYAGHAMDDSTYPGGKLWIPSIANDQGVFNIYIYYYPVDVVHHHPVPPTWTLTGQDGAPSNNPIGPGASNNTTTLSHRVINNGPSPATYNWYVQGCYYTGGHTSHCDDSGGSAANWTENDCSGTNLGAADNGSCPLPNGGGTCQANAGSNFCPDYSHNKALVTYSFPAGASSGDGYCERIVFSNATGPSTADGHSNDNSPTGDGSTQCVTYAPHMTCHCPDPDCCPHGQPLPNPPAITATCSGAEFNVGESADPGGTTEGTSGAAADDNPNTGDKAWNDGSNVQYILWAYPTGDAPPAATMYASNDEITPPADFDTAGQVTNSNVFAGGAVANDSDAFYDLPDHDQLVTGNVTYTLMTYGWGIPDPPNATTSGYYIDFVESSSVTGCYQVGNPTPSSGCSIQVGGAGALDDNNDIIAGDSFNINVQFVNGGTNTIPDPMDPSYPYPLTAALTNDAGNGASWSSGGGSLIEEQMADGSLAVGTPISQVFNLTAPTGLNSYTITITPEYWVDGGAGNIVLGSPCTATVYTYTQVNFTPYANSVTPSGVSSEDPTTIDYNSYVASNAGAPDTSVPTYSCFYQQANATQPSAASCPTSAITEATGGTFPPDYYMLYDPGNSADNYYLTYNPPANQIYAGSSFCSYVQIAFTQAYEGSSSSPNGQTIDTSTPSGTSNVAWQCVVAHNDPTFKVLNSGASAGGSFDTCSGGGELAGWNDNWDEVAGYDYGSSSQFNALSLDNLVGYASGVNSASYNNGSVPGAGLSFANNIVGTQDNYSPLLGGNFNKSSCFTDVSPPSTGDSTTVAGPYTISGMNVGVGDNKSIFVNGDVYITGNVLYDGDSGGPGGPGVTWASTSDIPSFVLHATGNIYISNNVTELDGTYISDASGGAIYDCSTGPGSVTSSNIYSSCNNQLVVYGQFEADNVDLMRTFGSLRDEQPTAASNNGSQPLYRMQYPGGQNPNTNGTNFSMLSLNNNSIAGYSSDGIQGYALPESGGSCPNGTVALYRTAAPGNGDYYYQPGPGGGLVDSGICVFSPSSPQPPNTEPLYEYFNCAVGHWLTTDTGDQNIMSYYNYFETGTSDPIPCASSNGIVGYIYDNQGTAASPPTLTQCSNQGTWSDQQTCAAEVFEYSPEIYGATPALAPPGSGLPPIQAITSLPPVL